ncbi:MAG: class I SAM-dependent methyltransferase [Candidatus Methanoperedens sp.]|nr:class I SAM-dependent methyltransferase [Candidatus Methanoperedens sp.]MCE8428584.1 class I SAM-dependent methyltransferase [Candidatus Methanoperedens sp.]
MSQKCVLCNNDQVFSLDFEKIQKRNFLCCPECDLIFVPEEFHLSPEDEIFRYRLHHNTLSNKGYVRMFMEKIAAIHEICPDVHSVLDYGCGPGPVLCELMKRDGFNCDIFDPNFFPDFPKITYDLVISTETFEHFRNIKAELNKIKLLLRSRGYLAIMTSFHDQVVDFDGWWYRSDPTHISFFGMHTFTWIADNFGFDIVHSDKKNFVILRGK